MANSQNRVSRLPTKKMDGNSLLAFDRILCCMLGVGVGVLLPFFFDCMYISIISCWSVGRPVPPIRHFGRARARGREKKTQAAMFVVVVTNLTLDCKSSYIM